MKFLMLGLMISWCLFGCSEAITSPLPHDKECSVQILEIEVPTNSSAVTYLELEGFSTVPSIDVDKALSCDNTKLIEFPLLRVDMGTSKSASHSNTTSKVDVYLAALDEYNNAASVSLKCSMTLKSGFTNIVYQGRQISTPVFMDREFSTDEPISIPFNSWYVYGAPTGEDFKEYESLKVFALRVTLKKGSVL